MNLKLKSFIYILLLLGAVSIVGCDSNPSSSQPGALSGYATAVSTTTAGPLHLEVWRANYTGGANTTVSDTTYVMQAMVTVSLHFTNNGNSPVILFSPTSPGQPSTEPYYLVDNNGRRYKLATVGRGVPGTIDNGSGTPVQGSMPLKAYPGQTLDLDLPFEGVAQGITGLTLVMEDVKTEAGDSYTFRLPVPLP